VWKSGPESGVERSREERSGKEVGAAKCDYSIND